jgi:hypothetical protein
MSPSSERDLTLVGRLYRQVRRSNGNRAEALDAALDAYRTLHPTIPEAEALETVQGLIKASSEAGRIWMDD